MINNNYANQPHFTGTFIPLNKKALKKPVLELIGDLDKYFELRSSTAKTTALMRDEIDLSQAAVKFEPEGITIAGKDREADEFIARTVKKNNPDAVYTQDTPETVFEGPIIDLTI